MCHHRKLVGHTEVRAEAMCRRTRQWDYPADRGSLDRVNNIAKVAFSCCGVALLVEYGTFVVTKIRQRY